MSPQLQQTGPAVPSPTTTTVPALFDTFEEVICRLPEGSTPEPEVLYRAFEVRVENDESHVTDPEVFVVYDSRCRLCQVKGRNSTCSTKVTTELKASFVFLVTLIFNIIAIVLYSLNLEQIVVSLKRIYKQLCDFLSVRKPIS